MATQCQETESKASRELWATAVNDGNVWCKFMGLSICGGIPRRCTYGIMDARYRHTFAVVGDFGAEGDDGISAFLLLSL
ncbi:hypothetical protein ABZP36_021316 [Zizania latifolia]